MFSEKKRGFTLAELLLVVAIIGIVSAMGMVISKKTTEQAYKKYYYTGFSNLYAALGDLVMTQTELADVVALEDRLDEIFTENKSGIEYRVVRQVDSNFIIDMGVPQPKTRQNPNAKGWTRLLYVPDNGSTFLIPLAQDQMPAGYVSLQDRADLLQAYVDTGLTGRNVKGTMGGNANNSSTHRKNIAPMSFRAAYCSCNTDYKININPQYLIAYLPKAIQETAFFFKHLYAIQDTRELQPDSYEPGHGVTGKEDSPDDDDNTSSKTSDSKTECQKDYILNPLTGECVENNYKVKCKSGIGTSWINGSCKCSNQDYIFNLETFTCTAPVENNSENNNDIENKDSKEGIEDNNNNISEITIINCGGTDPAVQGVLKFRMP